MARELELKFRADAPQMEAIRSRYPDLRDITMETAYYDTPERSLGARRETLRRRYENGVAVYALKTYLPDGSHGEWETEAGSLKEAISILRKLGAPNLPQPDRLEEICAARFTRGCVTISVPGGAVELALDQGVLLGGGNAMPLCEVELELKEGSDHVLHRFAEAFLREFPLEEEPLSKFARAISLTREA